MGTQGRDTVLDSLADIERAYEEMIGFVPPKVRARLAVSERIDPEALRIVERWRLDALTPDALDQKTVQLMAFGILLAQGSPAAKNHAHAAVKAGATAEQLHATAGIAHLFRGIAAFNQAGEIVAGLFPDEGDPA
jgi:alkylhydroperoxidase/carboxymuconolactone decarboxylase family protein YurZ